MTNKVDRLACLLYVLKDYYFEDGIEDGEADFASLKELLEDPKSPWSNGKHMGDCTKEPNTCLRCQYEALIKDAEFILKELEKVDV